MSSRSTSPCPPPRCTTSAPTRCASGRPPPRPVIPTSSSRSTSSRTSRPRSASRAGPPGSASATGKWSPSPPPARVSSASPSTSARPSSPATSSTSPRAKRSRRAARPTRRSALQRRLVETLNELAANLCAQAGASTAHIAEAVIVGNTAMQHLFARLPAEQLALAPYVAAASEPLSLRASDVGLSIAPAAYVYMPPNIAGYVGGDHVAMALGTGAWESDKTLVALDIGTNTEVTVARGGAMWCCSCASGPAFEGAHIQDGMRAAPGAIEKVQIVDGKVHLKTIDGEPPVGICGSGIMDIVSELFRVGAIDRKGAFQATAPGVSRHGEMLGFTLAPDGETGHGRPIVVTRKDVNEIQLAKAAIRTGVEILLQEAGAAHEDIDEFIVAGAFGTYLDLESTRRVGMFPPLPLDRFSQVGNAAGTGARQLLVSRARRAAAARLADKINYVELTIHPDFSKKYMKALYLA
ncbi:MAG: ASKHA domain-containing protein [Anaerolineae bacterium]|nr:ASKHA domain-containing protein [Anaerolineae bacterium]